ncbi:MAG: PspC domain-containing protein, partial [Pseudonocardiaceae bacterium]
MTTDPSSTNAPLVPSPILRPRRGRMVAGVAAWAAGRLGVSPVAMRAAFVALTFAGGVGIALYVIGWLLIPDEGTEESIARAAARQHQDGRQVAAVGMVVLGVLLLARQSGVWFGDGIVWPVVVAAMGLFVIWRQADQRPGLARLTGARDARSAARVVGGVALVAAGVALFLAANQALVAFRQGLLATMAVVSGVALVFAPWWVRLGRELATERRERIRSQERAEVAAHVHDSVLQTLALIQRNSHDPRVVASLARRQERDLRSWLFP